MKSKYLSLLIAVVIACNAYPQGVLNSGNTIKVESGAYVRILSGNFTNATAGGQDGAVALAGEIYLDGNWTNNTTTGNLILSGGKVFFNGSSTQQITHNAYRTSFYNLLVNTGAIVEVPAQKEVQVTNDLQNDGTFTLKSTSAGTASLFYNGNCQEDIKVERYLKYDGTGAPYHYLSSPVNDAPITDIWTPYTYIAYWYDETNPSTDLDQGWTKILSGNMINAKAYAIPYNTEKTLTFTGDIANSSDISISITYNNTSTPTADGWNLIGNPYPVSIDADLFLGDNTNIVGTAYFWDDGNGTIHRGSDYAAWNKTGSTATNAADDANNMGAPNGTIAIGQGFFVQALSTVSPTANVDYVTFKNTHKMSNITPQFFIPDLAEVSRIKLSLTSPKEDYNEILIGFTDEATAGKDRLYDAPKLSGNQYISLYSFIENDKYAIQGLPELTAEIIIPVGFYTATEGTHSFKVPLMENVNPSTKVFLKDLEMNTSTDLDSLSVYQFFAKKGTFNDRFLLQIIPDYSDIKTINANISPQIVLNGKVIYINNAENTDLLVQVFDMLGKKLFENKISKSGLNVINIKECKGFYIVNLKGVNTEISKLILIN